MVLGAPSTANPSSLTKDCTVEGGTSSNIGAGFTVNWNRDLAADGYYLDISTDANFNNFIEGYSGKKIVGSASTSEIISGVATGRIFYYRVRSYNVSGESANSDIQSVLTIPFRPALLPPTEVNAESARINWIAVFSQNLGSASQTVSSYKVTYSQNSDLSNPIRDKEVVNDNTYVMTQLSAGQTYYYQIIATNSAGDSCESDIGSISTSKALLKQTEELILQQDGSAILLELGISVI